MKTPKKLEHFLGKPKSLDRLHSNREREKAAEGVRYKPSPYHCPDQDGRIRYRTKPASPCPDNWTTEDATNAIKEAIRNGLVSKQWTRDGYPRHVWHDAGGLWYEACTSDNAGGTYHGYPVESRALPNGLGQ